MLVLEEGVGPIRCGVKLSNERGFAEFDSAKLPVRLGEAESNAAIAGALTLAPAEIGFENHAPSA